MPKVLFKHSGEIYNTEKTTLEEPLSSDDFINHGVDITTIDKSLYQEMYSQFDVLAYSEENEAEDEITLNIETFTPDITYNYSVSKYNLEEVSISPDSLTVNYDIDTDPKDYPMDTNVSIEINGVEYYSNNHNLPDSNSIEISSTEFKDGENTLSITIDNNSYEETIEKTTETINKVLFKSNGTIYKYNDGFFATDLTEPLTVEEYLQHGLSYEYVQDIKEEHLAMLDNQIKVKYFSDEYNDAILYLDLFIPNLIISNLTITPTDVWEGEDSYIEFVVETDPEGYKLNFDYSIESNGEEIQVGSSTTGEKISTILENIDEDQVLVIRIDGDLFEYTITKENRDTFTMNRRMQYDGSHELSGLAELKSGEGITGTGEAIINLPTEGKYKVEGFVVDVEGEVNYLISPDKQVWYGYNGTQWVEDYHMTKLQLESLTGGQLKELLGRLHKTELYIKAVLFSNADTKPILKNITTTFLANQPPYIINPKITPDGEHNNHAEVTGTLVDLEGDDIDYRISIKKAGEDEFKVADPNDNNGWVRKETGEEIYRGYDHSYFAPGENEIKIELKDCRGTEGTAWTGEFVLLNEKPIIQTLTKSDFHVEAVVSDEQDYKVDYKMTINDNPIIDFGGYREGPITFDYYWNNEEIIIGEENVVVIIARDEWGEEAQYQFEFIGQERGLFIVDANDNKYTNSDGDILKYLKMGQVIAGQKTEPKRVFIINNTGNPIEEASLEVVRTSSLPSGTSVTLSEKRDPFTRDLEIVKENALSNMEKSEFFVKVDTAIGGGRDNAQFKIDAECKDIIS